MPSFTELDAEQRIVYQGAPPDGTVLVIGPPGTGKTVMAFHRATFLRALGQSPRIIMYNRVLSAYVASGNSQAEDVTVSTFHSWLLLWSRSLGLRDYPKLEPYRPDWPKILEAALVQMKGEHYDGSHWGHLIVDEGQDFESSMYRTLAMLISISRPLPSAPAITVFADENQRLNERANSSLQQIREALQTPLEGREFRLTRNYRNTRQIALFAQHFQCGLQTGASEPPRRNGKKPTVVLHSSKSAMIDSLIAFIGSSREHTVGVICPTDRLRSRIHRELKEAFASDGQLTVQGYSRSDKELRAEDLVFDEPGYVTILNSQSAKGLEFDSVVIVDPLLAHAAAGSSAEQFKMNMYVMCSRARRELRLAFVSGRSEVLSLLPETGYTLIED